MSTAGQQQPTILVVDDTPFNIELLSSVLERQDYNVISAMNGERALELVEETKPEIILLDINMPGLSGYEVCQKLKSNPKTSDIPVIFISALGDIDDIVKAFELGGVDYIIKPFRAPEVMVRVDSHITLARQRRQIEAMRERDRQHYETLDKIRQEFIGNATHDLKSPIALVGGYAYLLETHEPLMNDPTALDYIDSLKRGAERMSSLVNDMLDLLQMETRQELVMEPLQLATVLEDAAIDFRLRAEDKQIALSVNLPPGEVNIYADNDKITRVIDNLLSNAIKYTPPGGNVTMTGKVNEGMVLIEVNDTGSGIPKKDIPHLFEPFYRVKSIKQAEIEGTGLGLSIVKSIVDKHKGSIEIESVVGEGSTFRVSLPIYMNEKVITDLF